MRCAAATVLVASLVLGGCLAHERDASDAARIADAGRDAPTPPARCDLSQAVAIDFCSHDCAPRFAWNGWRCRPLDCGECFGRDCDQLYPSSEACATAHTGCPAALCLSTGGRWIHPPECGHRVCGAPSGSECGIIFLGYWPLCDCGAGRNFHGDRGCVADPSCMPPPPGRDSQFACTSSGGTWTDRLCCATRCGRPCGEACDAAACDCGPLHTFDAYAGCVLDVACLEGGLGAPCSVDGTGLESSTSAWCADGLTCCHGICQWVVCDAAGPQCVSS